MGGKGLQVETNNVLLQCLDINYEYYLSTLSLHPFLSADKVKREAFTEAGFVVLGSNLIGAP